MKVNGSQCDRCGEPKHRGRCKRHEVAPPAKIGPSLDVPAGFGFRASIEDDRLQIEQDAQTADGKAVTQEITLSKREARDLIDWIAELLEAA